MTEKQVLKANEYQCAHCYGVYEKIWSDEEANAEKDELFGDVPLSECAVICDDCFKRMVPTTWER